MDNSFTSRPNAYSYQELVQLLIHVYDRVTVLCLRVNYLYNKAIQVDNLTRYDEISYLCYRKHITQTQSYTGHKESTHGTDIEPYTQALHHGHCEREEEEEEAEEETVTTNVYRKQINQRSHNDMQRQLSYNGRKHTYLIPISVVDYHMYKYVKSHMDTFDQLYTCNYNLLFILIM